MIDIYPIEIVAYAESDIPSQTLRAPDRISSTYVHNDELPQTVPWYVYEECPVSELPDYVPQQNIDLGYTFYWLYCNVNEDGNFPVDWRVLYFKHNDFYRADIIYTVDGEDIFFLYNFGEFLFDSSFSLTELFDIDIGGYNLFYVLFGTGIFAYIGWTVFKWFLPF